MLQKYYRHFIFLFFLSIVPQLSGAESLYILYTSNVNGALENCGCGDKPLGGIGKIKHISDSYKKTHANVVLIDGGDFFNNYPYKELNAAMLKVYQRIGYDFVVPGDQIFIEDFSFYQNVLSTMKDKMVISNLSAGQNKPIVAEYGPYNVSFTSILSPNAFDYIPIPENLELLDPEQYNIKKQVGPSLNIVVYHGYLSEAKQFARKNVDIDILFIGHDEESGVWWEGDVCIIGNGKDSESITIVEARYANSWKIDVEKKLISHDFPVSGDVLEIIDEFKDNPGEE